MISESIIHIDMHKPNKSWLVHNWNTFNVWIDHGHTQTHKTHRNPNLGEATCCNLALGLRSKQKGLKGASQEECEKEYSHSQVSFPFGSWSPGGLLNL